MDEMVVEEKPGLFSRVAGMFTRQEAEEFEEVDEVTQPTKTETGMQLRSSYRYTVTVRRQIVSFDDALAAANGFKRGEQQIINLSGTEPALRERIKDFLSGVNYAQEGTWEEVGEHIYMIVPHTAYIEVAPPSPHSAAGLN